MRSTLLAAAVTVCAAAAQAQPIMLRGADLEKLDFLAGRWSVSQVDYFSGRPSEVKGEVLYRWLPGEVWLQEEARFHIPGVGSMYGSGKIAWDREAARYVRYWTDNQTPLLFVSHGRWTDARTLEFNGSFEWRGKTIHTRATLTRLNAEELRTTYFHSADGRDYRKMSEGTYVRRAGN